VPIGTLTCAVAECGVSCPGEPPPGVSAAGTLRGLEDGRTWTGDGGAIPPGCCDARRRSDSRWCRSTSLRRSCAFELSPVFCICANIWVCPQISAMLGNNSSGYSPLKLPSLCHLDEGSDGDEVIIGQKATNRSAGSIRRHHHQRRCYSS
jgi:hypothetical protein